MIIDHIYNHADLALMAFFNELLELLRRAVFGLHREELHGIVAPIVIGRSVVGEQGILSDGEHFHRIDAEIFQVVQFLDSTGERVIKRPDVQLINHHGIEGRLGERRHTEVRVHDH